MTSKNEYFGLAHEAGWYDPNVLVVPYSVLVEALTAHTHSLEKTLREKILQELEAQSYVSDDLMGMRAIELDLAVAIITATLSTDNK